MFTKMFEPPPLANDYSYADRMTTSDDHAVSVVKLNILHGIRRRPSRLSHRALVPSRS